MRLGVIYKVSCGDNFLIGSSIDFPNRKASYISDLKLGKWSNRYLQRAYNKYGKDALTFSILQENIPEDILRQVENIWIGVLCARAEDNKKGMNLQDADAKRVDKTICKERAIKIINTIALKGRKRVNCKKVYQYALSGEFIKEWDSATDVEKELGFCLSSIAAARRGKLDYVGIYQWKDYKIDNIPPISLKEKVSPNRKKVYQIDENDNVIKYWETIGNAAKELNINERLISLCCRGLLDNINNLKFKFDSEYIKNNRKSVKFYQYDLYGNFIKEWDNVESAAHNTNISSSQIRNNLNGKNGKAGNFQWSFEKKEKCCSYKTIKGVYSKRKVNQYTLNGEFIKTWDSITDAKNHVGLKTSTTIAMVCKKLRNKTAGYKWEYA